MKKLIMSAAILMLVCCGEAEATSKDDNITNQVIKPSIVKPITDTVVLFLDDMTFDEAFSIEHRAKGEGHTFWWRGEEYTTNLLDVIHNPSGFLMTDPFIEKVVRGNVTTEKLIEVRKELDK